MAGLTFNEILDSALKLEIEERKNLITTLISNSIFEKKPITPNLEIVKTKNEEYQKLLRDTYDYGQEEFDKNILYVSSSALGLTIAFIEKIVKLENAIAKTILWNGWFILGFTIVLYVLSHLISTFFIQRLITNTNRSIEVNPNQLAQNSIPVKINDIFGKNFINGINILLFLLMTSGIIYILIFLYKNLIK